MVNRRIVAVDGCIFAENIVKNGSICSEKNKNENGYIFPLTS